MSGAETFFATCAPGLEAVLHDEVRELRLGRIERQVGGVHFTGELADAWRANLQLRTAVRVLWRLSRFEARDDLALYRGVQALSWDRFLRPRGSLVVSAQTRSSRLNHSRFIEQRTKDAIVDQFLSRHGARPDVTKDAPDVVVHVHLFKDRCTLSIDTSGDSLHKRGWRRFQGRAPLAETLAAAMVLASGWDRRAPLLDPFCGSGTIIIEAALIASRTPPGRFREFAFERFPFHDAARWQRLREGAIAAATPPRRLTIRGRDEDEATLAGALENVRSAGVEDLVALEHGDGPSMEMKPGWNAWIITNPPYGERVGSSRPLAKLYADLGRTLRERCRGYHLTLLSGNPRLLASLGFTDARTTPLKNGALDCRLLDLEVG